MRASTSSMSFRAASRGRGGSAPARTVTTAAPRPISSSSPTGGRSISPPQATSRPSVASSPPPRPTARPASAPASTIWGRQGSTSASATALATRRKLSGALKERLRTRPPGSARPRRMAGPIPPAPRRPARHGRNSRPRAKSRQTVPAARPPKAFSDCSPHSFITRDDRTAYSAGSGGVRSRCFNSASDCR